MLQSRPYLATGNHLPEFEYRLIILLVILNLLPKISYFKVNKNNKKRSLLTLTLTGYIPFKVKLASAQLRHFIDH